MASRRTRVPSLPLLAGVAVLAISAGGALQAMHPDLAGAGADGRLSPASALSGSSAVGSANLARRAAARRSAATPTARPSRLAAAAACGPPPTPRPSSATRRSPPSRGRAEKRAAQIKLHQWVLPVRRASTT